MAPDTPGVRSVIDSSASYNIRLQQSLSLYKERVQKIAENQPTVSNVFSQLEFLASAYDKGLAQNDAELCRQCQLLASKHVLFAKQNKMQIDEPIKETARRLGVHIPSDSKTFVAQLINVTINYSPSNAAQKIGGSFFEKQYHDRYAKAHLSTSEHEIKLPGGIQHYNLFLESERVQDNIGEMIHVSADNNVVSAGYTVERFSHQEAAQKGYLVFCAANYSSSKVNRPIPATASIVSGKAHNLYVDATMHGIVVMKNGRPEIFDTRENDIHGLMEKSLVSGGTMFQCNLLVKNGGNIVPAQGSSHEVSLRRVLATFNDGSYSIIQINRYVDLYDAGEILAKIADIKNAVNLDTGGSNVAGYRYGDANYQFIGETRNLIGTVTSATMFYVKADGMIVGTAPNVPVKE